MSRASEVMNNLELAAKALGMGIEDAVDILRGKHPTYTIVPAEFAKALAEPAAEGTKRQFVEPGIGDPEKPREVIPPVEQGNDTASTQAVAGSAGTAGEGGAAGEAGAGTADGAATQASGNAQTSTDKAA